MKGATAVVVALVLAAGLAGGYWIGTRQGAAHADGAAAGVAGAPKAGGKKLLFYRNPMGLPDTSPVPKKDAMGMDYIPVYEGEGDTPAAGGLSISPDRVQKLGVRTQPAGRRSLDRVVRAAGRVEVDERRLATIAPKYEGYVERLLVNATGQAVSKGQPLFEAYSPEIVSAQREYLIVARGAKSLGEAGRESLQGMEQLAESALLRLRNWDVPAEEIAALEKTGEVRRTIGFRSPVSGIVMDRKATLGMRFMPGEMLYQIADLSSVWVLADVNEQDISLVRSGVRAQVHINAYSDRNFDGLVTYIYPTLNPDTRTVQVRLELANPGNLLKPGMFANVEVAVAGREAVLAVPTSALIDSGVRRVVIVQAAEGRFEPREVEVGARSSDWVEIRSGVKEGENVVVAANFLIDAESNLRAALGGMGGAPKGEAPAKGVAHRASGTLLGIAAGGQASIKHGPVPTLGWPGMTMDFALANEAVASGIKPGGAIEFEFVERKPGEFVVTSMKPAAGPGPTNAPANPAHQGH